MRYRHVWPGLLLLASLALLLGGLIAWGDHFLSPAPSGGIARLLERWARPYPEAFAAHSHALLPAPVPEHSAAEATTVTSHDSDDVRVLPTSEPRPSAANAEPVPPRYSVELGTFALAEDAERAEARLNQAGFSTVRFRQRASARLYTVTAAVPVDPSNGATAVDELRRNGFADAAVVRDRGDAEIRIAREIPLRDAEELADKLRSAGHDPRISAEPERVEPLTLRHGTFSSRQEAEAAARELAGLGVASEVVQIR